MESEIFRFDPDDHDFPAASAEPHFPAPESTDLLGLFDDAPLSTHVFADIDLSNLLDLELDQRNDPVHSETHPSLLDLSADQVALDVQHSAQSLTCDALDWNVAWHGDDYYTFTTQHTSQGAYIVAWPDDETVTQALTPVVSIEQLEDVSAHQNLPAPSTEQPKCKVKRAHINTATKRLLDRFFSLNAYPTPKAIVALAELTALPEPTIRTWFTNARARKHYAVSQAAPALPSSPTTVSVANLNALNRASPAPSNASLDRYLAASRTQEPVPVQALEADQCATSSSVPISIPSPPRRPDSNAGSVGSWRSMGSVGSFRSIDSRGSRRGRRGWTTQTPMSFEYIKALETTWGSQSQKPSREPTVTEKPLRYFCTWPECDQKFRHRFEWGRHEEAVHYCPYNWVCCSQQRGDEAMRYCFICNKEDVTLQHVIEDHLSDCASKPRNQRTFFRQDQLQQHVRRHRDKKRAACPTSQVPQLLLTAWKEENLEVSKYALHCGFCGKSFLTWAERTEHVFWHISKGSRKPTWWPERLPAPIPASKL